MPTAAGSTAPRSPGSRAWPRRGARFRATTSAARATCSSAGAAWRGRRRPRDRYSCRLVTLGRSAKRGPAFEQFKPFFCYVEVEGDLFTIVKQTGSQRPAGRLWEDDIPTRLIFLGSLALGNEEEARAYGDDPRRDVAGVFERIAPFVWRLVIPFPQDGTKLRRVRTDPGGRAAQALSGAGRIADPARSPRAPDRRRRRRPSLTYSELLAQLGHGFSRPKMRALCKTLGAVDEEAEARGEPELAVLVVRQSDGLPGQGWWVGGGASAAWL